MVKGDLIGEDSGDAIRAGAEPMAGASRLGEAKRHALTIAGSGSVDGITALLLRDGCVEVRTGGAIAAAERVLVVMVGADVVRRGGVCFCVELFAAARGLLW